MDVTTPAPFCPQCGQKGTAISYGLPTREMWEAAEAGMIHIGGCIVWEGMPTWRCPQGHDWNEGQPRFDGSATVVVSSPERDVS